MIVWIIGGLDPSGGAGILADTQTLTALGIHPFSICTVLTAQNGSEFIQVQPVSTDFIESQFSALIKLGKPDVIKIGCLPNAEVISAIAKLLMNFNSFVIYDPIMETSTGFDFMAEKEIILLKEKLLKRVDLLTPNRKEAERLLGFKINTHLDCVLAINKLCQMGIKQVILKGGHFDTPYAQDVWSNGKEFIWLTLPKLAIPKTHGTGCVFSASLAAFIASKYDILDAFVLAKMGLHQSLKNAYYSTDEVAFPKIKFWPSGSSNLPWLTYDEWEGQHRLEFPHLVEKMGFYPIVECAKSVQKMISSGAKTIQLRIKNKLTKECEIEIKEAIKLAKNQNIQLFINDYWEFAIKYNAYGVHLGFEDLKQCDTKAILESGLRLGVSTHCYSELSRAHALQPSYVTLGPIYSTNSKKMRFKPQGLVKLKEWRQLVTTSLVAIGGINLNNISEVLSCEVDGVALISALSQSLDPNKTAHQFLTYFQHG